MTGERIRFCLIATLVGVALIVLSLAIRGALPGSSSLDFYATSASPAPISSLAPAASATPAPSTTAPADSPAPSSTSAPEGCPTAAPAGMAAGTTKNVTIETAKGNFTIAVKADLSPIAAANFVALASCGYYDGVVFHRVVPDFVIQGGDPTGTGTGGPGYTIPDEPVTTPYHRGTVAMARTQAPNSVGSQFFVVLDDSAAEALSSANTYQIIGEVTSGMDAVDAIAAAADQEMPTHPIAMDKVTVAP